MVISEIYRLVTMSLKPRNRPVHGMVRRPFENFDLVIGTMTDRCTFTGEILMVADFRTTRSGKTTLENSFCTSQKQAAVQDAGLLHFQKSLLAHMILEAEYKKTKHL